MNSSSIRPIIAIGASLGGLEVLCNVVGGFNSDLRAPVLIVLHTSEQSPRLLARVLGSFTSLRVAYARDGEKVGTGSIAIAPPGHHLTVDVNYVLHLDQQPKEHYARPAVDPLFRSAANAFGKGAIGVVLSGGDGDGTAGMRAIKANGGYCIVQDPGEALAPGMPLSALHGDHPDLILPAAEMAEILTLLAAERDVPTGSS